MIRRPLLNALAIVLVVAIGATLLAVIVTRSHTSLGWLQKLGDTPQATASARPSALPTAAQSTYPAIPTGVDGSVVPSLAPSSCKLQPGPRPDHKCSPGALNPAVTQATIGQTICVPGWTDTVRPSTTYTNKLKAQQIIAYGFTDTRLSVYEEDHLIPLELGGHPRDPRNLWPEPRAMIGGTAEKKDQAENTAKRDVCAGRITLAEAQRKIAADWA